MVDDLRGEDPLVGDVVDRQDGTRAVEELVPLVDRLQIEGDEPGLPVIAMEDLRRPSHTLAALDCGARQEGIAQILVAVLGVDLPPRVEPGTVYHIDSDAGAGERGGDRREGDRLTAEGDRHVANEVDVAELPLRQIDGRVEGHEDADIMPTRSKVLRERSGN